MVIRVNGHPGSGKTTLCNRLAKEFGYPFYYGGGIFREMAKERGMSIEDFYIALSKDQALENSVDEKIKEILRTHPDLVIDSRTAPFFPTPHKTFNILLTVDPTVGAKRNLERPENSSRTLEEMLRQTQDRLAAERAHYKTLYNIDNHFGPEHYDLVIDTTSLTPDQVFEQVLAAIPSPPTR